MNRLPAGIDNDDDIDDGIDDNDDNDIIDNDDDDVGGDDKIALL